MGIAFFSASSQRASWMPLRMVQYLLAFVAVLQFGGVPYADHLDGLGMLYYCYIFIGFNKLFILGFFMTYSRGQKDVEEAMPVVSKAWPIGVVLLCFLFPSTNWFEPTFLTYPFLERPV